MYKMSREISFCYGHRLLNYSGKCRYLHGHNGRAIITLQCDELDSLGMVLDFSDLKQVVVPWIENEIDHRMLLHKDDPFVQILKDMGEPIKILECNPTAENIARLIFDFVKSSGYPVSDVVLWETASCFATYAGH